MYTAFPDVEVATENRQSVAILYSSSESRISEEMVQKMLMFASSHKAEDFIYTTPAAERTQFINQHRTIKKKGGKAPVEFAMTEDLIDLKLYIERGEYEAALPLYFHLRKYA